MEPKRVLRDRSKLKPPISYEPKVDPKDFKDDISVDSDWDNEKEIDKIIIKEEDKIESNKDSYEYDDFVVPDDENIEIEESESESESEYEDSEYENND